jgi:hypothetical protein
MRTSRTSAPGFGKHELGPTRNIAQKHQTVWGEVVLVNWGGIGNSQTCVRAPEVEGMLFLFVSDDHFHRPHVILVRAEL